VQEGFLFVDSKDILGKKFVSPKNGGGIKNEYINEHVLKQ